MSRKSRRRSRNAGAEHAVLLPERAQHDRIRRAERPIADATGGVGVPYIAETALGRLYREGQITREELAAGEEFRRLYRLAYLDPLRAASLDERGSIGTHLAHGSEAARRRIVEILRALGSARGSLMASCAEHVIGSEETISAWARGRRWRGEVAMNDHVAKGVLLATLGLLAALLAAPHRRIKPATASISSRRGASD
jgi:hypothetical protein